jgi:hypothetical protein
LKKTINGSKNKKKKEKKMAECVCLPQCPFFHDKMANKPALAELMKQQLCLGDNTDCARYMVFKKIGRGKVPINLYPSQIEKAKKMIAGQA